jgi:hypothetical protein
VFSVLSFAHTNLFCLVYFFSDSLLQDKKPVLVSSVNTLVGEGDRTVCISLSHLPFLLFVVTLVCFIVSGQEGVNAADYRHGPPKLPQP